LFVKFREILMDDHFLGLNHKVIEIEEGVCSTRKTALYGFNPNEWQVTSANSTVVNSRRKVTEDDFQNELTTEILGK
jgi:hypothetical protein